jgi:4-diphosphocytidyl-2-C-methyl-D-erythritol kinase
VGGGVPARVEEPARAKVNLTLGIVGRRDDGYHLVEGLVAFTALGDSVVVEPASGWSLTLDGPFAAATPPGEDNLCLRAGRLLAEVVGRRGGAAIGLTKRLPVAAGIGGGSADAAAVLRGLGRLWGLAPADPALGACASRLGADVPVCLAGRTAFISGIGDVAGPGPDLAGVPVLLANPGPPLATAAVFAARHGPFSPPSPRWPAVRGDPAGLAATLAGGGNDLTAAATGLVPAIADVLAALAALPGCLLARMSGSGATCFGLFTTPGAADAAARAVAGRGWWVAATVLT